MAQSRRRRRSPLRILAPLALIAFALALVLVISSAGKSGGGGTSANAAAKKRDLGAPVKAKHTRRVRSTPSLPKSVYVVKANDTLEGIAQTTGVPVARLLELNPGIDQFSLVAGQQIKLR